MYYFSVFQFVAPNRIILIHILDGWKSKSCRYIILHRNFDIISSFIRVSHNLSLIWINHNLGKDEQAIEREWVFYTEQSNRWERKMRSNTKELDSVASEWVRTSRFSSSRSTRGPCAVHEEKPHDSVSNWSS